MPKRVGIALQICAMAVVSLAAAPVARADEQAAPVLPTVVDVKMHFRPILHAHGVEFRWFRYAVPKVFKSYEIIRSSDKGKGNILDGAVAGETANRYSTNFEETLDAGTYHYQLCSVTKTKRICSKPVAVIVKNKLPESMKTVALAVEKPAVEPKAAPAGQLELTVTRDGEGNAVLSWTPLQDAGAGFKWYKPVRSQTVGDPYYPRDGYLAHLKNISQDSYLDDRSPSGTSNYRICAVDGQNGLFCGNVVTSAK
ncbi:hypothetical protein HZC53_05635 [Candidatus Uhrbacteria bacterium]|nr:hypothetical protein [Candidatus Uhrbacteria bacterium]